MIRLIVVDNNELKTQAVSKYFSSSNNINVVYCCKNYEEFHSFNCDQADVILVNLMINGLDGLKVLSRVKKEGYKCKVIVYSEFITNDMFNHLNSYCPDYVIRGTYSNEDLEEIINFMKDNIEEKNSNKDLKVRVTNLLHTLGVPSHVKGFNNLRDGIILIYNDPTYVGSITKRLYPDIAKMNNSSYTKVERTIRHAIEVAWNRGDYDKMEEIFGNSVDFDRAKPTNSEFLVTLADRLRIENK